MRTPAFGVAILWYLVIGHAQPAVAQVDQQRAQEYFKDVQALCERDGARLWGVSICAPMVIGDMRTRTFATSQPAPAGDRPQLVGLVNAPIQWGGVTWGAYAIHAPKPEPASTRTYTRVVSLTPESTLTVRVPV